MSPFVELMESQGIIKKVMKPLVLKDRNKVIASENSLKKNLTKQTSKQPEELDVPGLIS